MKGSLRIRALCAVVLVVAATGCSRGITSTPGDAPNLEKWVADVRARPATPLDPLPVMQQFETFEYAAQDLRAIEEVDGIAMVAKARRADVKDPDLFRHGDGAVMLCLGWFATLNLSAVIDYIPVPGHSRGFDNKINSHADLDFRMPEPGGW